MSARNCLSAVVLVAIVLLGTSCEESYKSPLQGSINATDVGAVLELPAAVHEKPIKIRRAITIKGESGGGTILEVTSDTPAIEIASRDKVVIDSVTIKWQLATSDGAKKGPASAIVANDATVILRNCRIIALGSIKRSPGALHCDGFSNVTVENCRFEGFEFTIAYRGGAEGIITDSVILNPGHCGATVYSGSTMEVVRTIVTGGGYHALRNTGGKILAHDNLLVANKNRGVYLGNKPAAGRVYNNLIVDNGAGISAFSQSDAVIENNVIVGSQWSGIGTRESCPIRVRNNIFADNAAGIALYSQGGAVRVNIGRNTFYNNNGKDGQDIDIPVDSILVDPRFKDTDSGDYTAQADEVTANNMGLTDPAVLARLWGKYKAVSE